jgi:hypothetical protein
MDPFVERNAFINQLNQQRMQNQIAFNTGGPTNPAAGLTPGLNYQQAMQQAGLGNGAPSMAPNYGDSMISRLNQAFSGQGNPFAFAPQSAPQFAGMYAAGTDLTKLPFTDTMQPNPAYRPPVTPYQQPADPYASTTYAYPGGTWGHSPHQGQPQSPAASPAAPQTYDGKPVVYQNGVPGVITIGTAGAPGNKGYGTLGGYVFTPLPHIAPPFQGTPYQTGQQGGFKYDKDPTLGNAEFQRWLDIKSPARTTLYDRAANERMYDQFLAEEEKPPVRPPVQGPTRPVVTGRPGQARPIEVQLTGEERRRALIAPRQYSPEEAAQRQRIADLRKEADQLTAPKAPKYDLTDYYRKLPSGMKGSRPPQRS